MWTIIFDIEPKTLLFLAVHLIFRDRKPEAVRTFNSNFKEAEQILE